ncbi:ricin-type beta-trefoil lectin domain protein [Streptomyces sp. NBC_01537]|uniref:ricin-type beta-trefoil lectin domain protein n=1 Tax=Streptomyces sp. NBC_01537 TaxID=2903896 RepID=UPI00386A2260
MTASPDDRTAAAAEASPLPRRTQKSSAIADAASGANARRAANKGGPAGTASARRAAAVPAVPAAGSGESEDPAGATSSFADGFAAGLAFAPLHGAGQNALAADADGIATGSRPGQPGRPDGNRPPRRRRKALLAGGAVLGALLIGIPLFLLLGRGAGDARKDASASVTAPGDESDQNATGAGAFSSMSPSIDSSSSPLQSPTGSPSASAGTKGSAGPGVASGDTKTAGGSVVHATPSTSATSKSTSSADGVKLVSYASGRCIDVSGGSGTSGARLEIMDCTGGARQTWKFMTDGTVRAMGLCMDVNGGSREDTAWVQLVTCNGTGAQQFVLNSAHDLVNTQADKCVDVTDSETANGTYLQQWTCNGGSNQKWHTG